MSEMRTVRELRCKVEGVRLEQLGKELAMLEQAREDELLRKRVAASAANMKIKELRKDIRRISDIVVHGGELAEVPCIERPGLVSGSIEVERLDTHEIFEIRKDEATAQGVLPLSGSPSALNGAGKRGGKLPKTVAIPDYARSDAPPLPDPDGLEKAREVATRQIETGLRPEDQCIACKGQGSAHIMDDETGEIIEQDCDVCGGSKLSAEAMLRDLKSETASLKGMAPKRRPGRPKGSKNKSAGL